MFRSTRVTHRWIGLSTSLFLVLIATTGFLLSIKKRAAWLQPPVRSGTEIARAGQLAPVGAVAEAVFAQRIPELASLLDVDRFELHVGDGIYKVTSKKGYKEVQVDASTAQVLSVSNRNDQFVENVHDLSFFGDPVHDWLLPLVAVGLFTLGVTGTYMFSVPVFRRAKYRRTAAR